MERQNVTARPCPFINRCAHAGENCSEETSVSCDVISKTKPPQPKGWDPQAAVAVSMTLGQWDTVIAWLKYGADWNHAKMTWWRMCCDDKRAGAETAASYESSMIKAETILAIIEDVLYPPAEKETE